MTPTPRAEMKPRFGDLVENSSAGDGNPQKRGFFVRFIGRASDRRWQLTDGKGEFWEIYETLRSFPDHRLTVVASVNRNAELVEALKEARSKLTEVARMSHEDFNCMPVIERITKALTEPETE